MIDINIVVVLYSDQLKGVLAQARNKNGPIRGSLVSSQITPHCWEHTSGFRGTSVRGSLHVTHVQLVKKWAVNLNITVDQLNLFQIYRSQVVNYL